MAGQETLWAAEHDRVATRLIRIYFDRPKLTNRHITYSPKIVSTLSGLTREVVCRALKSHIERYRVLAADGAKVAGVISLEPRFGVGTNVRF